MITETVWPTVKLHGWKYRSRAKAINGILWHSTRGNQGYDGNTELNAFCNWMRSPNNRNPGAPAYGIDPYAGISSVGIGPGRIVEVVPDTYIPAWSSWQSDERKLSVEVAQSNRGQAIEPATIAECVRYAKAKAAEYGFPLVRVFPTNDDSWIGMAGHEDTLQGKASGKSDPGPEFWVPFLAALNEEEGMTDRDILAVFGSTEADPAERLANAKYRYEQSIETGHSPFDTAAQSQAETRAHVANHPGATTVAPHKHETGDPL